MRQMIPIQLGFMMVTDGENVKSNANEDVLVIAMIVTFTATAETIKMGELRVSD